MVEPIQSFFDRVLQVHDVAGVEQRLYVRARTDCLFLVPGAGVTPAPGSDFTQICLAPIFISRI